MELSLKGNINGDNLAKLFTLHAICLKEFESHFGREPWSSLWETTHVRKVVGLNPGAVYWMDESFSHLFIVKLYCLFVKTETSDKVAGVGPFKKRI